MAADTRHTPGPWIGAGPSFGDPLPRYTTEIIAERVDGADAVSICELPFAHHDDENEANARLIASAPELLEALQALLYWDNGKSEFDDARALIKKVTHG